MQRLKNHYLILSKRCRNTTNSIAFRPLLENVIACSAQFCETSAVICQRKTCALISIQNKYCNYGKRSSVHRFSATFRLVARATIRRFLFSRWVGIIARVGSMLALFLLTPRCAENGKQMYWRVVTLSSRARAFAGERRMQFNTW